MPLSDYTSAQSGLGSTPWFTLDDGQLAGSLTAIVSSLENQSASRRRQWVVHSFLVSGTEVPRTFGYSMGGITTAAINTDGRSEPYFNVVAQAVDVLANRIGRNEPWPYFLPQGGDYKTRIRCKYLTKYVDALFSEMQVYKQTRAAFRDALTYGDAFIKVFEGLDGRIKIERVLADDIYVDVSECRGNAQPKNLYQRSYFPKTDLLAAFPEEEDQAAIKAARAASSGVLYQSSQTEMVALVEAWHLPSYGSDGKPKGGRHVMVIGDHVLKDEEWKVPRFPFAQLRYQPVASSFWSQSLPDQVMTIQKDINITYDVIQACQRVMARPHVLVHNNSEVSNSQINNAIGGIIRYRGTAPNFITPPAVTPELYDWLDSGIARAFKRVGISEQSAGGVKQNGLESGLALRTWNQIEDARHVELGMALEDFILDIAIRVLDLAKVLKPEEKLTGSRGRVLKWSDVELPDDQMVNKIFPISRLPQLPAGRQEQIEAWFKEGSINRQQKMRLEGFPDTEVFLDLQNAAQDNLEWRLDGMIETGEFVMPEEYQNLDLNIETTQARYLQEQTLGLEEDRLDLLRRYIDESKVIKQRIMAEQPQQPQVPAPMPAAPPQQLQAAA